jgi:hypothetical protein
VTRVRPTDAQYERLLEANAHRCCVCKRRRVGLHLHHIDGNNANTVDPNLAVLCVEDHDRHHRPNKYAPKPNHTELSASELRDFKIDWELFVVEARSPEPRVLATLSAYGTVELVHSLQLVMQWPDERIAMKQSYHLLDGNLDRLTDEVLADLASIGPNVKMAVISEPVAVEHCPCCGTGYSRTLKPAVVARLTDPGWETESSASIYVNPAQPSLAILISLRGEQLVQGHLHLCEGCYLHYHSEGIDDRVPVKRQPGVRTQASQIVATVLQEWKPAMVFVGTGNPNKPRMIGDLALPKCWERHRQVRMQAPVKKWSGKR